MNKSRLLRSLLIGFALVGLAVQAHAVWIATPGVDHDGGIIYIWHGAPTDPRNGQTTTDPSQPPGYPPPPIKQN